MFFKVSYINGLIILKIIQRDSESIYNHFFFNYLKSHHQIVTELGQTTTNFPKGSGLYFPTTHSPKQEKQQVTIQLMTQSGISNILIENEFKLNNKFFKCFEIFSSISLGDINLCVYKIIKSTSWDWTHNASTPSLWSCQSCTRFYWCSCHCAG